MEHCLIVVGYNNVRIYDIAKLRAIAQRRGLRLMLLTERPQPQDYDAADAVIVVSLDAAALDAAQAVVAAALTQHGLRPLGILPFSDRGILLGARLATRFGLPGPAPAQAAAGLDKRVFRALDQARTERAPGYQPVFSTQVDTLDALQTTVATLGGKAFVKPASEGNSRGCHVIRHLGACAAVWQALAPYRQGGVIVETLIEHAREYSWDYVAGQCWITEKHTTQDEFRAEYQQIVPAPLLATDAHRIDQAGRYMRALVSDTNGAYHNEIFHRDDTTWAVETNMRPAGMHIWDLAALSFPGFNPWEEWVAWALDDSHRAAPLQRRGYSGIRMLRAPADGILLAMPDIATLAQALGIAVEQAGYSKQPGDIVSATVRDNAAFIGQIILHADDHATLRARLDALAGAIEASLHIAPHAVTQPVPALT
ncbi:ATP-grasp domain-containing protein [Chitiniphilus eburneus]|uniref:ATP-grasp domain-containing protein n=1 Tax=Chitiniphilus eburneus TaxID=2571148 RepID=A0A4U0PGD7_9NEIS|nr:ATP-grasp domain-containing protein [Chitiniphilus eburneus]TJZ66839.1 ATP-grasp domain-containing protein [Chitiniphilus eburneus]